MNVAGGPVALALVGAGRMGSFHAATIARRLPGVRLTVVADPTPGAAERLVGDVGSGRATTDTADVFADPDVDGVVIASPASTHADLVVAAAAAGKAVFCEKPMATDLGGADRAVAAARDAGVGLQVGFNRRFAPDFRAAQAAVADGRIGTVQLMRSLTRDPHLANPGAVRPWTIFLETLIHDFDALAWLNPGARPVSVYAVADALVAPQHKADGLLDTAVVVIRYDNGAIATAEASFQAVYGYDVRAEVLGSAGMVTAGDVRRDSSRVYGAGGVAAATARSDAELFADAYTAELAHFTDCIRAGTAPEVGGDDARAALTVALACIRSVEQGGSVDLAAVQA